MSTDQVQLSCAKCGSKEFTRPAERELQPDDVITCNGCGQQSTYGVLQEQVREQVHKMVTERLRNVFKKR